MATLRSLIGAWDPCPVYGGLEALSAQDTSSPGEIILPEKKSLSNEDGSNLANARARLTAGETGFVMTKMEPIHWRACLDRDPPSMVGPSVRPTRRALVHNRSCFSDRYFPRRQLDSSSPTVAFGRAVIEGSNHVFVHV